MKIPEKPSNIQATPEQWQAICQRGDNLLVSASAGSGKTKVLVERILQYINDGISIDQLLIVTFTEAAAKEMKERIRTNLEKAIQNETNLARKTHYLQQLQVLPNAIISTIHSFCMKIIQRYFYLNQLDPVFSMLDEIEGLLLREKIWERVENQLLEQYDWMEELMHYFSTDRSDERFTQLIYRLYDFSRSKQYPKEWLASLSSFYKVNTSYEAFAKREFTPYLLQELTQLINRYDRLIKQAEIAGIDKIYQVILSDAKQIQDVLTTIASEDYTTAYQLANTLKFNRWPTISKNKEELDLKTVQLLKQERDLCKKIWEEQIFSFAFFLSPQQQLVQLKKMESLIEKLSIVVLTFYEAFQQEKKRSNKLDFSDLEHDALAILSTLKNGERLAATYYQQQFIEVLVDEYQDVNRVQEAILTSVSRGNNLFMVGDVKQSIYAFRLADPTLFRDKYEQFSQEKGGKRIILAENFRSRNQVLAFTNHIFRQIMDRDLGDISYDEAAALKTGNDTYSTDDQDKTAELHIIQSNSIHDPEEKMIDESEEFSNSNSAEIHLIAHKIKEMMEQSFEIMDEHSTKESPQKRVVNYSDIAILVPTKKNNALIEEIFNLYQIPVIVQKNNQYFKRTEIAITMAALKIIDNPQQDIPFVAVLRSGMVGLDEIALAHIRKQRQHQSFFSACQSFVSSFELEEVEYYDHHQQLALKEKVELFLESLENWRDMANHYPISQLIWKIYMDTHYLSYVHGQSNGKQRALNLHALYQRASDFERAGFTGLRNFVRFIQLMQQKHQDLEEPTQLSDQQNAVRVMTIHASKGLEYPVVFLMNAGKKFNFQDIRQQAILSDKRGLGAQYIDLEHRIKSPTIPYLLTRQTELNTILSEEMRKLYVAMTRAREKLIIVGTIKNLEKFELVHQSVYHSVEEKLPYEARYQAKTYLDWLLLATMRKPPVSDLFVKKIITIDDILIQKNIWLQVEEDKNITEEIWLSYQQPQTNRTHLKNMLETLKQPYAYQLASNTASYQSVSEIKRMNEEFDIKNLPQLHSKNTIKSEAYVFLAPELSKPKFLEEKQPISASQRGSALHLLMQQLDLSKPINTLTIHQTLEQLIEKKLLEKELADAIAVHQVLEFFTSEFGLWLIEHQQFLIREQPFSYVTRAKKIFESLETDKDSLLIHGIIDGFVELEHEIVLFDYKTDYVVPTKAGIQAIIQRYQEQLTLYAEALETSYQKKVSKKMLCLLSIGQNIDLMDL